MKPDSCLHTFFDQYLPRTKGVSFNTIQAYRATLSLFLPFAAKSLDRDIKSLEVEHLSVQLVLDFLDHLEAVRKNCPRTRGHRSAAFKSLLRMISFLYPEYSDLAERILSIPQKRFQKKLSAFLAHEEVMRILDSIDLKRRGNFRDYTIIHLLYDSGARAAEITSLRLQYFDPSRKSLAILGKGNRYRQINLWPRRFSFCPCISRNTAPNPSLCTRMPCFSVNEGRVSPGVEYTVCAKNI